METDKEEFKGWRSFFWPVYRSEWKKFFPMLGMFFLIAFNYNLLRTFKDSMVVTAPNSGAETIPFIKVWAIIPCAILLTYVFTRLANRFSREKVFYIMMFIFLSFFFLFTFVLYPLRDYLHPHEFADRLQALLPSGFKGLIAIFRNWTFTLFYVMCDLWSSAIFSVLFWGFMNEVTSVHEAKRYYGLLMIGANASSIMSGQISVWFSDISFSPSISYGTTKWEQSVLFLNCTIIACGILAIAIFRWLNTRVLGPAEKAQRMNDTTPPPEKVKMSMRKNMAYLAKSKYLICIAAIVLTYNVAINLVEVVWKNQIHALYPDPSDFQSYMGQVTKVIGIVATFAAIFVTGNVIRRFSWTTSAMIPAAVTLVTGLGFFAFILFQNAGLDAFAAMAGFSPLAFGLFLGSMQNIFTRASKYTFFDATKEMAFIPLSNESKLKGKAAIDGVGSRLGKSGGSVIHQGLLLLFTTVSASTPVVAGIFIVVLLIWILSVISLGKQFDALVEGDAKLEIPETPAPKPVLAKETA
ncbi:MAG: NTP/NDP exchange transporter [Verrucomicrobiota bacterium]|nr:NTP/NDP exchange transporter [Verrucomicrobiota bacterium]